MENKVYPLHFKIPQPNGTDLPIHTHELEDSINILGFCHFLDASKSDDVREMSKGSIGWVDRINTVTPLQYNTSE